MELAQLLDGNEMEPSKTNLKIISKELRECMAKVQSLTKSYLASEDTSLAADAHELLGEVDEVIGRGQKRIRRLGLLPEGSEVNSLEIEDVQPRRPTPKKAGAAGRDSFLWRAGGDHGGWGGERQGSLPTADSDLAMLLHSLGGPRPMTVDG